MPPQDDGLPRMETIGGPLRRAAAQIAAARISVVTPDGEETYAEPEPCPICWVREVNHVACTKCGCRRTVLSHRWNGEKQDLMDCECVKDQILQDRVSRVVGRSGLERRRDVVFSAYRPLAGQEEGWQATREFVSAPDGWLYLYGAPGTGKTTMASCAGNAWLDRAMPAIFRVVPDLLDQLRATFAPGSEVSYDDRFAAVMDAKLLILDDYGRQKSTEWAEEKLYQILNHRWLERLSTIITTNLQMDELDPAIYSRVNDERVCRVVLVEGQDQRRPPTVLGRMRDPIR